MNGPDDALDLGQLRGMAAKSIAACHDILALAPGFGGSGQRVIMDRRAVFIGQAINGHIIVLGCPRNGGDAQRHGQRQNGC